MANKNMHSSLTPNSIYHGPNGAIYYTDQYGRICHWSGEISSNAQIRNYYAQRTLEGKNPDQQHAGHLLASNQGGSGEKFNMVPMNAKVNQQDYRAWEKENEALYKEGYTVKLSGSNGYTPGLDTNAPEAIMATREVYKDDQYLYTEHFSITNFDIDDLEYVGEREALDLASEYNNPVQYYYDEENDAVIDMSNGNGKNSFDLNALADAPQEEVGNTPELDSNTTGTDSSTTEQENLGDCVNMDDEDGLSL